MCIAAKAAYSKNEKREVLRKNSTFFSGGGCVGAKVILFSHDGMTVSVEQCPVKIRARGTEPRDGFVFPGSGRKSAEWQPLSNVPAAVRRNSHVTNDTSFCLVLWRAAEKRAGRKTAGNVFSRPSRNRKTAFAKITANLTKAA